MFGNHFYHRKVRTCVAIFGKLFNNLYVVRPNNQVKVPLSYAPKDKYLERIRENPDLYTDTQVAIKLPRMSFEITSFAYDNQRQLTKVSNFNTFGSNNTNRQKFFSPVPYNINFQLNIYAKNQDDALQIVEQILPTFNPQYTLTIKPFTTEYPDFKEDIPIIIQGLSFADDFEGGLEQRRTIIYTLDFEMKVSFHGAINTSDIIRQAKTTIFDTAGGAGGDSDIAIQRIDTKPNPLTIIGMPDSDFGFTNTITLLSDSA